MVVRRRRLVRAIGRRLVESATADGIDDGAPLLRFMLPISCSGTLLGRAGYGRPLVFNDEKMTDEGRIPPISD